MHVSASGSAIAEGRADANKIKTAGKEVVAGNRNSWKFEAMKRELMRQAALTTTMH
tara:strand:+ start:1965 stop:2132 length:168 start_codon:yes stop_codon:yes gene_type:complete